MNKQRIIVIIGAIIIGIAGAWFYMQSEKGNDAQPIGSSEKEDIFERTASPEVSVIMGSPALSPSPSGMSARAVKEFRITASNFKFSMNEITVKKGDIVSIRLKNEGGQHDLRIDGFYGKVATRLLQAGQEDTIEFVADKTGRFEYYCSVGSHRQIGMKGTLVVEE